MGNKKKLEIQQLRQREQEAFRTALTAAKKKNRIRKGEPKKRKDTIVLAQYLSVPLCGANAIRTRGDFVAKPYNLGKQVIALVDHLFVRYPPPSFLYKSVLSREGVFLAFGDEQADPEFWRDCGNRRYVRWFHVAAQGGSLAKEMSDVLSRKECHWFLQAPMQNSIGQNLLWAKCAALGMARQACQFVAYRMGSDRITKAMGDRTGDVLRFYAQASRYLQTSDLQQLTDFVLAMLQRPEFSFKGRTLSSMLKLSHEWHNVMHATRPQIYRTWASTFKPWLHKTKTLVVRGIELTDSRALADEGHHQRHCVAGYGLACTEGHSKIVSLRWVQPAEGFREPIEVSRITLEIRPTTRTIVQIRGRLNRQANKDEMHVVRLWAGDHGLLVSG